MKVIRFAAIAVAAVLFSCGVTRADDWLKTTRLTFAEETQVPGAVLNPGTYIFLLRDHRLDLSPAQILSGDRRQTITTFFVRNGDYVTNPRQDAVVRYAEQPNGQPPAIEELFYPGDLYGMDFIYPAGATLMSKGSSAPAQTQIASAATPAPAEEKSPASSAAEAAPLQEENSSSQPATSSAAPGANQSSSSADPSSQSSSTASESKKLPKTASNLPAETLAGLLLLGAGTLLAARRRWRFV